VHKELKSGQSATGLMDDLIAGLADVGAVADPPGNKWHFALGALFALSLAGRLDDSEIHVFEKRIQAEAARIHEASKA
jgi:hypothetical protein